MINGGDVRAASAACQSLLESAVDADWTAAVPGLDFTVASVVAHAANGPLWYALDLWGGPGDDAAFDLNVEADAPNAALLVSLRSAAQVCAASVVAAPADTRGFHSNGPTGVSTCRDVPTRRTGPGTASRSPTGMAASRAIERRDGRLLAALRCVVKSPVDRCAERWADARGAGPSEAEAKR